MIVVCAAVLFFDTISSQVSSKHVAATNLNIESGKRRQQLKDHGRQHHLDHRRPLRDHFMCDHRLVNTMLHPRQTLSKYHQVRWKMHPDNGCRHSDGSRTCQRIVQTRSSKSYYGLSRCGTGNGKQYIFSIGFVSISIFPSLQDVAVEIRGETNGDIMVEHCDMSW